MTRHAARFASAVALVAAAACASVPPAPRTGPAYPDFPALDIPASLRANPADRDQHTAAWARLQAADLRSASRAYTDILRRSPSFYPAEAGLGFVALADRQFKTAAVRFRAVLARDNRYVPAWRGLIEAELGAGNDEEAIAALERLIDLDGAREADKTRLELLRLRQVQALVQAGTRAHAAGRLDEADELLTRALALSPSSAVILSDLALVEIAKGQVDEAEVHAQRAVTVDPNDAGAHGALAAVWEARGRSHDAVAELARAAAIDPDAWRARAAAAGARLDAAAVPPDMHDLAKAATVTRGELAALIGTRLEALIARAPRRIPDVASDARGYWAASEIMAVTRAGIMDVYPNHTFQPTAPVRRADLADAVAELVLLALVPQMKNQPGRDAPSDQLTRWLAARPEFADLAPANLFYRSAALAVTAGAMAAEGGRFQPTRAATGAEVLAAIARIEQLMR